MTKKYLIRKVMQLVWVLILTHTSVAGQSKEENISKQQNNQNDSLNRIENIINFGKKLLGKPYKYVFDDGRIMDCSGFITYVYGHYGFNLPSSSGSLATVCNKVSLSEIKKGDLMFFKGRNSNSKHVGHVSMVTSVEGDVIEMMHSCKRGIILEKFNDNRYYTSRLLFAGRLPQIDSLESFSVDSKEIRKTSEVLTDSIIKIQKLPDSIVGVKNDLTVSQLQTVKIIGVGDIMLGTNFPNTSFLPPNDGKNILQPVKEIINKGNVSFGNLEGAILTGEGTVKTCSNPKVCYAFKMPDHYVNYLLDAGFDLVSIANNHSQDFGIEGTSNTTSILQAAGIHYAGLDKCPYTTFEKDGIKYGFAAFSPNTGTIKINDYLNAKKIISYLDTICDIVIVSFHGGAEGSNMKHITRKTEMFLGENRGNPYEFSRIAIDAGADVVLGHGPHVTRAIDLYKDRFIAYSLGNFATYGRFNLSGPNGIAPIIELNLSVNGEFISGKIYSTVQLGKGGPIIDEQNRALKEIQELTQTDIPECMLKIESNGTITK